MSISSANSVNVPYLSIYRVPFYVIFINCEVLIMISNYVEVHSAVIKVPLHDIVAKVWVTLFIKHKFDPLEIYRNILKTP